MVSRTKINKEANRKLKQLFLDKGITRCEVCGSSEWLSFAHRHKRVWYYSKPDEMLWDFNQVILACVPNCHMKMEKDAKLTEQIFDSLRGSE